MLMKLFHSNKSPKQRGRGSNTLRKRKQNSHFCRSPENANILYAPPRGDLFFLEKENDFEQEQTKKHTITPGMFMQSEKS